MRKLKKQLLRFFTTGIIAVVTDFILYFILIEFLSIDFSKFISFISGTFVAFLMNKFWTFEKKLIDFKEVIRFILLYSISLLVNVLINHSINDLFNEVVIAFLIATACSASINFLGQKFWVFK